MYYRQPFSGDYPITQGYGETVTSSFHTGIDYGCPANTPILASETGMVVKAGWDNTGYGNFVIILHPDGNATLYAHLNKINVTPGMMVNKGQVIGYSGSTGNSTGAHLHFEARHKWDDYKSHFDPMTLPLHSEIDNPAPPLKDADQLGQKVEVVCAAGAKAWNSTFQYYDIFPQGTDLTYTGKTKERNGYTYCEVYPAPRLYYVAVNDGTTQILDNRE